MREKSKLDNNDLIMLAVFLIKNVIVVICLTILAVHFDKWWIILFSLLLSVGIKTRAYRVCDGCGRHSPFASTHREAIDKARKLGWVGYKDSKNGGEWEDYCPDCVAEGKIADKLAKRER